MEELSAKYSDLAHDLGAPPVILEEHKRPHLGEDLIMYRFTPYAGGKPPYALRLRDDDAAFHHLKQISDRAGQGTVAKRADPVWVVWSNEKMKWLPSTVTPMS